MQLEHVPCCTLSYSSDCPEIAAYEMCRDCGQAIAALAYGIGKVPAVDVIVGPGNKWVTAAKSIVSGHVGIDMLAGPSECLVLADHTADAAVIAADLLAQAEHDTEAIPILGQACPALPQGFAAVAFASCVLRWPCRGRSHVSPVDARTDGLHRRHYGLTRRCWSAACLTVTTTPALLDAVDGELERQLTTLTTADTARVAVTKGFAVLCATMDDAVAVCDRVAPEHLEVL